MMNIIGVFGMIAKRETLFFYLPVQIVSEHSIELDGWLRIEGLLLQLTTLKKSFDALQSISSKAPAPRNEKLSDLI